MAKCERHRVSLEQSLSWGEPRCAHQLYGQMIIRTSFLSGLPSVLPLLYDSEDRATRCRFGEGGRLCGCRRLSLGSVQQPGAFRAPVSMGAAWHPSTLKSAALEMLQPPEVLCEEGQNFPSV